MKERCGVGPGTCPNEGLVRFREGDAPICAAHLALYLLPVEERMAPHLALVRRERGRP